MAKIVFNVHTGECLSGEIPKPPPEWLWENILEPFINRKLQEEARGKMLKSRKRLNISLDGDD